MNERTYCELVCILVMDHQLSQMQNIIVKCSLLVLFRPYAWRHSRTLGMGRFLEIFALNHEQIDVLVIFEKSDISDLELWLFLSHAWCRLFALLLSRVTYVWIMKVTNFMQCCSVSQFNRKPL